MGNVHGFIVKNWKNFKPTEDAFAISRNEKTIALADAITRDPGGMQILPSFRNPLEAFQIIKFFKNYPNPNPAKGVANLFCKGFLDLVSLDYNIKTVFEKLNKRAEEYGENWRVDEQWKEFDYLEHDFPACVAVGLTEKNGVVSYGFIADCGFAIFNRNGERVFRTPNEGPNTRGKTIDEDIAEKYKTSFKFPEGRKIIRSLYRNNPSNKLAYGALTGEKEAMHYVRTGEVELGDNILAAYTDGLEHVVYSDEFANLVRKGCDVDLIEKLCQRRVGSEGSLVLRR
jgi:hypothetical protein